jgi:Leucine-rich repeat (LRR) protein
MFAPQWFGSAIFLLLVVVSFGGWWWLHGHWLASSGLMIRGATVDWDWSEGRWLRGGQTSVDCSQAAFQLNDEDLPALAELKHVVSLNLSGCAGVTVQGLAVLAKLPDLEVLDLGEYDPSQARSVPQAPAASKPPRVTDDVLDHLRGLKHLRELNLSGADITDKGLAKLAGLTNLEVLDLSHTKVTDAGLVHLKGFRRLRTLILDSTSYVTEGSAGLLKTNPTLNIERPGDPPKTPSP